MRSVRTISRLLAVSMSLAALTGCGLGKMRSYSGSAVPSPEWPAAKDRLGPTVLLVTTSPGPELGAAVGKRLAEHPGTQMVTTRPAPCITDDAQIIRTAGEAQARTAVVLCLAEWGYVAGLDPYGRARYELRALDIPSGKELFRADLTCRAYGRTQEEFDATGPEQLIAWSMASAMKLSETSTTAPADSADHSCN